MENKEIERVENLERKMYMTKYCRINAYKRTKAWDSFLQALLFFSNLLLIGASISSIIFKIDILNILIVIFSVISFSTGLFIGIKNYAGQSLEYKRCYNEIEKLSCELKKEPKKIDEIEKQFEEMISFSLNHDEQDNYRLKCEYYDDKYVMGEDLKNGKDFKYWKRKYSFSLAKDIVIKTIISFGIYLVFLLLVSIVGCVGRCLIKIKNDKKEN